MKELIALIIVSAAVLTGCGAQKTASDAQVSSLSRVTKANHSAKHALEQTKAKNRKTAATISSLQSRLNADHRAASVADQKATKATASSQAAPAKHPKIDLAAKNYTGQQEIVVDQNNPGFSRTELNTSGGAWERYTDLDGNNRAVDAQALLNQSLMPTAKREPLTWDPTGWHNRRTAHGWLYNRSHLIGFQLSGENNNPKNLITGTMSLNNPLMLAHEMDIATYLKSSRDHYVRYDVRPVYRGNELVARGVQMRAQSIGDNTIRFNVYIFNVESGYTIDYTTGTSTTN